MHFSYNIGLMKETFCFKALDCSFNLLVIVMRHGGYYIQKITKVHYEHNYTVAFNITYIIPKTAMLYETTLFGCNCHLQSNGLSRLFFNHIHQQS